MATIIQKKQGKKTYYYYQETYRVKINKNHFGKKPGSGKSRVCTRRIYLGPAEHIMNAVKEKRKPISLEVQNFGLIAAAYQVADQIGLIKILRKHILGQQSKVHRWIYFFVTIINRLDHATSKNKMKKWLQKTILPQLLSFDANKFTSKNFWYATDDVISEEEIRKRRRKEKENEKENENENENEKESESESESEGEGEGENAAADDDLMVGIEDDTFNAIESELFHLIDNLMGLSPQVICYDTTNFYTYIDEPARSKLAKASHSKDSKHHLKHIGLLMAVEKSYGIPLISRVYRANSHDSKLFSFILADLIIALKKICKCDSDSQLVLVLDKGNNSQENFTYMDGKISWVGALVPSHYQDLIELELDQYHGNWKGMNFYRCSRKVMECECVIVLTFNPATKRKQQHSLKQGIEKLKQDIIKKWNSYKKTPGAITQGIKTMKKKSGYGNCLELSVRDNQPYFRENDQEIKKREKRFGKNLIFSNLVNAETGFLIDTYIEKNIIESDFQLLKDTTIIRFRPIRHWTDSKIRAYAFCCVISMTLLRVMQWMAEKAGYKMSANMLKEELTDIKEVIMVYSMKEAERKISQLSAVQKKLWDIFQLEETKKIMLLQ